MIIKNQPTYVFFIIFFAIFWIGAGFRLAIADSSSIAVLYPDVREPFRTVFLDIIRGINSELPETAKPYILEERSNTSLLRNWLERENVRAAIALGTSGLNLVQELRDSEVKFVVGAVLVTPDGKGLAGVTLIPDPEALFQKLKQVSPEVKNIRVVYNPKYNAWLIDRARQAASRLGMTLDAFPAEDLRDAATTYRQVLNQMAPRSDALWLPPDPLTADERVILPLILEQAWNRNLAVFSSNPAHVKRGILLALYPDNFGMGQSLGRLALDRLRNGGASQIQLLQDLLVAVNLRTADHLNIKLAAQEIRKFDLVFPSK